MLQTGEEGPVPKRKTTAAGVTAVYVRVSNRDQNLRSQRPDLERWVTAFAEGEVRWYEDKATGRTMARPGWLALEQAIRAGEVRRVVVWRLDRLGRTASQLVALLDELAGLGVGLVSMRESLDLDTPAGRLMARVLASVAEYELELRGERQRAGIDAAWAAGKRWGGRKAGDRYKVSPEMEQEIRRMRSTKPPTPIARIARLLHLSRPTVYRVLEQ